MHHINTVIWKMSHDFAAALVGYTLPSAIYRPSLKIDGNKWCALYGESLEEGIAGFGDTPAEAMAEFDKAWLTSKGIK